MSWLSKKFKKLDSYGEAPGLKIDGEDKFQTCWGACVTIIAVLIVLVTLASSARRIGSLEDATTTTRSAKVWSEADPIEHISTSYDINTTVRVSIQIMVNNIVKKYIPISDYAPFLDITFYSRNYI
jgi:hypothetical protein